MVFAAVEITARSFGCFQFAPGVADTVPGCPGDCVIGQVATTRELGAGRRGWWPRRLSQNLFGRQGSFGLGDKIRCVDEFSKLRSSLR